MEKTAPTLASILESTPDKVPLPIIPVSLSIFEYSLMIGVTFYLFVNLKIVILNLQTSKFLVQEESLSNTSANGGIFKGREGFGGKQENTCRV